jgi:hypothetical protein
VESVPEADRGPRAGDPRGVVDATGSSFIEDVDSPQGHPVAIPIRRDTDFIAKPLKQKAPVEVDRGFRYRLFPI